MQHLRGNIANHPLYKWRTTPSNGYSQLGHSGTAKNVRKCCYMCCCHRQGVQSVLWWLHLYLFGWWLFVPFRSIAEYEMNVTWCGAWTHGRSEEKPSLLLRTCDSCFVFIAVVEKWVVGFFVDHSKMVLSRSTGFFSCGWLNHFSCFRDNYFRHLIPIWFLSSGSSWNAWARRVFSSKYWIRINLWLLCVLLNIMFQFIFANPAPFPIATVDSFSLCIYISEFLPRWGSVHSF